MFCTTCGAELADHMSFCSTCGAAIARAAAAPPPPALFAPDPPAAPTAELTREPADEPAHEPGPSLAADLLAPAQSAEPRAGRLGGWLRTRRLLILSRSFLALALLGTGILLGWLWASDRTLAESEVDRPVAERPADELKDAVSTSMPDVRGLTTSQAQQVLVDAGVAAARIEVVDRPAAGTSGVVIEQVPAYGQTISGTVTITGSAAAKVPQIQGRSAKVVLDELDEFGAEVRTVSRYVPGATTGSVVRIKPAPGTLLPVAVTVTIAAEPGEVALAGIDAEDWGCSTGDDQMNGKAYTGLISCSAYTDPQTTAWLINRAAHRLTATIGIPDSAGSGANRARLVIKGDGRVLGNWDVRYGRTQDIDVDVSGVLRLSFEVSSPDDDSTAVGVGNALLLGDQDSLDALGSGQ